MIFLYSVFLLPDSNLKCTSCHLSIAQYDIQEAQSFCSVIFSSRTTSILFILTVHTLNYNSLLFIRIPLGSLVKLWMEKALFQVIFQAMGIQIPSFPLPSPSVFLLSVASLEWNDWTLVSLELASHEVVPYEAKHLPRYFHVLFCLLSYRV